MDAAPSDPFLPMALGFFLAIALIVAAFFHEAVLGVLRALVGSGARALGPVARVALAGLRRAARRPAAGRPASATTRWRLPWAGTRIGRPFARRPRRPAGRARPEAPPAGAAAVAEPADAPSVASSAGGEADGATLDLQDEPRDDAPRPRPGERRRLYQPASRIHVEEAVRAFLERRGGAASLDGVVRHLDSQFGSGLGIGLVESLRRRGTVTVHRGEPSSTRITVTLSGTTARDAADG